MLAIHDTTPLSNATLESCVFGGQQLPESGCRKSSRPAGNVGYAFGCTDISAAVSVADTSSHAAEVWWHNGASKQHTQASVANLHDASSVSNAAC
jgi:hypothetical protein